ncbi:MAG: TraB/GumN family protein [Wenzhouxiangellaceae bacterium]
MPIWIKEPRNISVFRALVVAAFALVAIDACRAQVFYSVLSPEGRQNWLLGTIHSEDDRVLDFPPVLEQALEQADTIALELLPDQDMLEQLAAAMRLPRGQRLSDRLDDALYRRVVSALRDYGMARDSVDRLQPWAAALTLAQPPVETGQFMDLVLARQAVEHGAEPVALEAMDEQLAFFTGMGEQAHIALLESAVADHEHGREDFEALVAAYVDADLEQLRRLAECQLAHLSDDIKSRFREQGIVQRNDAMARRMQPLLDRGATLVAVGALHLPGEKGLIARLREQGNQVEAIY